MDGKQAMGSMRVSIGAYQTGVDRSLKALNESRFAERLARKDASLWRQNPDGAAVINNRLGWIDVAETMRVRTSEINAFVSEVVSAGFTSAVLMGMGGSSLSPEVSRLTFGIAPEHPNLRVLDTTDPRTLLDIEGAIDIANTLFIVATKSGTTIETLSAYRYFYEKLRALKGGDAGRNFIAITDPGTPLVEESKSCGFRRVFENFADIGGRYSALSYFGLIPAAIIGADVNMLIERAIATPIDEGIVLGAVMAELARKGRDKLTLISSPEIAAFGFWVEQLVAESTGKAGKGIVPVEGERPAPASDYGSDRHFVYMRLDGGSNSVTDAWVAELGNAGQPIVTIPLRDRYDLGREYLRWEIATGTACALMGVNAFDEPNVKESKDNTSALLEEFHDSGHLPNEAPSLQDGDIGIYSAAQSPDQIRSAVVIHLDQFAAGDYFALMAFIAYSDEAYGILQEIRTIIGSSYKAATTLGYGPRFLHSTGQLHKGGPNTGIFIQFTADDPVDAEIPGQDFGFSILKQAQAMGDGIALKGKRRRFMRIHLGSDIIGNLRRLSEMLAQH